MQRNRFVLLALAALVIVAGFVALSRGSSSNNDPKTKPENFTLRVSAGKPAGAISKLAAVQGETINLTVKSDVTDEIHIHGYDLKRTVKAGGSLRFSFPASIAGIFVIELESKMQQIASLEVKT